MHRVLLVIAALLLLLPPALDVSSMLGYPNPFGDEPQDVTLHQVASTAPAFLAGLKLTLAHYLRPSPGLFAMGVGVQLAALARLVCLFVLVNTEESMGITFVFLLLSLILVGLAVGSLVMALSRAQVRAVPAGTTPRHLGTAA